MKIRAVNSSRGGIPITPQRFVAQWEHASHWFDLNLYNFEVRAGETAVKQFQKSFQLQRFNSKGEGTWAPRSKNTYVPKGKGQPILIDTGSLRASIKSEVSKTKSEVKVYTDPNGFSNTSSHQGFCYAAVHNGPSEFRRGSVANMPRRQFMGYSTVVKDELNELVRTELLKHFPK